MRTEVEIVVDAGRSPRLRATGGLAVRQTGVSSAHLIGTAATPLGGDHIEVVIRIGAGAFLDLGSVAATIALPAADRPDSTARWHIEVGAGARLRVDPQPTVVAGGAHHRSDIVVVLDPDATLDLHEHVQIGRSGRFADTDAGGRWQGGLRVDLPGLPVLRHRVALGPATTGPEPASTASGMRRSELQAVSSVFRYPDVRAADVDAVNYAARLTLPGDATLTTALAESVPAARALCDALDVVALSHA
ncbi:urease accessory protein UreD [Gordonia sp. NPDC003376]